MVHTFIARQLQRSAPVSADIHPVADRDLPGSKDNLMCPTFDVPDEVGPETMFEIRLIVRVN
jgi:hypothetical protein